MLKAILLSVLTTLSCAASTPIEVSFAEALRSHPVVIAFRSTARTFRVDWHQGGSHKREFYSGPLAFYTWSPETGTVATLTVEWQDREERFGNHKHTIEVYHHGKLVGERVAEGVGVMSVRANW